MFKFQPVFCCQVTKIHYLDEKIENGKRVSTFGNWTALNNIKPFWHQGQYMSMYQGVVPPDANYKPPIIPTQTVEHLRIGELVKQPKPRNQTERKSGLHKPIYSKHKVSTIPAKQSKFQ